jgi:hypothetical protein
MLRNNITSLLHIGYISYICVTCVSLYKYINKNKGLASYTRGYTEGYTLPRGLHCVTGGALS